MLRKLRSASSLNPGDLAVVSGAWFMLLLVDLGLRVLPFPVLLRLLGSRKPGDECNGGAASPKRHPAAERVYGLVDIAARNHLYPMLCLRRALVLQWLLARRGMQTTLRLGVDREAKAFQAHAWVELDGGPVGERQLRTERYALLTGPGRGNETSG